MLGKVKPQGPFPPVSIFKPLCGINEELLLNLRAVMDQDYEDYQVIFGVADPSDKALTVVKQIIEEYPDRDIAVVSSAPPFGLNPKVRNMNSIKEMARHDLWLISDADVRPKPDYLTQMVSTRNKKGAGVVQSILGLRGDKSIGAALDVMHLSSWIMPMVYGITLIRIYTVCGKSMLFDRNEFEALGGFESVKDHLAEDNVIGDKFVRSGSSVEICTDPLPVTCIDRPVKMYINRHLRWHQMRFHQAPFWYMGEPIINTAPIFLGLIIAALMGVVPQEFGYFSGICLALDAASDALIIKRISGSYKLRYLPLNLVKDILDNFIWAVGLFRRRIVWNNQEARIGKESLLTRTQPKSVVSPAISSGEEENVRPSA